MSYYCTEYLIEDAYTDIVDTLTRYCHQKKYNIYRKLCQWLDDAFIACYENYFILDINHGKNFHLVKNVSKDLYLKVLKRTRKHELDGVDGCLHLKIKVYK